MAICSNNNSNNNDPYRFGEGRDSVGKDILPLGRIPWANIQDPQLRRTIMGLDSNLFGMAKHIKKIEKTINIVQNFINGGGNAGGGNGNAGGGADTPEETPDNSCTCSTIATITSVNGNGNYSFTYSNGETSTTEKFITINNSFTDYGEYQVGDAILVHKVLINVYKTT